MPPDSDAQVEQAFVLAESALSAAQLTLATTETARLPRLPR